MPPAAIFNPAPTLTDALLASLADPTASLSDLAKAHNTTLEALSLWIASPAIAERLEAVHHIAAVRTRFIATNFLAPALHSLNQVLTRTRAQIAEDDAAPPEKQRTPEQKLRTLESARRAAGKIVSLASFNPPRLFAAPRAHHPAPTDVARASLPVPPATPAPSAHPSTALTRSESQPPATNSAQPHHYAPTPRSTQRPQPAFTPGRSPATLLAQVGNSTTLLNRPHEHWP